MRIFAAVLPPTEAVKHLDAYLEPRRAAGDFRWAPAEQLHVTLAFVAEAEEWRVDEYVERLGGSVADVPGGVIALRGCVAFPDAIGTRVLAVGVEDAGGLLPRLSSKARGAASRSGLAPDGQRFRPHATIARTRRPTGTSDWVRLLDGYAGPAFRADAVHVVASHLGEGPRGRPRHETLATLPLRKRGSRVRA